jgi:RNA polymerase sporulation-specific sigma factor
MNRYDRISDEQLIVMLRNGESDISDYLMEKYKGLVRKKARAMFLIGGDTDDLIQEGMIGLFKAVQDYQPDKDASFLTFAKLCIDRQLYTAIQTSRRQKHQPLNSYVSLSEEGDESDWGNNHDENPEAIIIDQENTQALRHQIHKSLSPLENKVLNCYLEGYDYNRIAQMIGRPTKSVDNALRRIRKKIEEFSN